MRFLLAPLSSPEDEHALKDELSSFAERVKALQNVKADAAPKNIGLGADWTVISLNISAVIGLVLFFPELHKRIRESAAECRIIYKNIENLIAKISGGRRILSLPTEILYLKALEQALSVSAAEDITLVSIEELPVLSEVSHGTYIPKHLLFCFVADGVPLLVAASTNGEVLWSNSLPVKVAK